MRVPQLSSWQPKEWEHTARLEVHAHDPLLVGRVDHDETRVRAREEATAKAPKSIVVSPVVHPEPVLAEVYDQLHRAVREATLSLVPQVVTLVVPEQLHELRQRWPGYIGAVDHGACH
jgi:hypothetical protein